MAVHSRPPPTARNRFFPHGATSVQGTPVEGNDWNSDTPDFAIDLSGMRHESGNRVCTGTPAGAYFIGLIQNDLANTFFDVASFRIEGPRYLWDQHITGQLGAVKVGPTTPFGCSTGIVTPGETPPARDDEASDEVHDTVIKSGLAWPYSRDHVGTDGRSELRHSREDLYSRLGRRAGPLAADDARELTSILWGREGAAGARWLAERLRTEIDVERQTDAEEALITTGRPAAGAILDVLSGQTSQLQAEALLVALRWIGIDQAQEIRTRRILRRYADSKHVDVRLAATKASRVLPETLSQEFLRNLLREEDNEEVRDTAIALLA